MGHQAHLRRRLRAKIAGVAAAGAIIVGGTGLAVAPLGAPAEASAVRSTNNDGLAPIAAVALNDLQTFVKTASPKSFADYVALRSVIATAIADRLGVAPARMIAAWEAADIAHQTALMAAFTQLGVPYRRLMATPGVGLDCSGLTLNAWAAAGVTIPRQSAAQMRAAAPRTAATAMAGDLMYYPGHLAMYLGVDRTMIHSPYPGRNVEVSVMRKPPQFADPAG